MNKCVKHSLAHFWCFTTNLAAIFVHTFKWPLLLLKGKLNQYILVVLPVPPWTSSLCSGCIELFLSSLEKISEREEVREPMDVTSYASQPGSLSSAMTTSTLWRLQGTRWFSHLEAYEIATLFIQFVYTRQNHSTPREAYTILNVQVDDFLFEDLPFL